jgi:hypothetical protein
MESLSPSTINVRLSAVRKMIGEARKNGMLGTEEAATLTDVPNISQKGTRLGNWLTREQAKELLAVPDRSTLKGKRDYASSSASSFRLRAQPTRSARITSRPSNKGRDDGSWPTLRAKAGASAPSPSRSGSSRASTPGGPRPGSRTAGCCGRFPKAGRSIATR